MQNLLKACSFLSRDRRKIAGAVVDINPYFFLFWQQ